MFFISENNSFSISFKSSQARFQSMWKLYHNTHSRKTRDMLLFSLRKSFETFYSETKLWFISSYSDFISAFIVTNESHLSLCNPHHYQHSLKEELEFLFSLIDLPTQNSVDKFPNPRLYSFQVLLWNLTWPENRRWKT